MTKNIHLNLCFFPLKINFNDLYQINHKCSLNLFHFDTFINHKSLIIIIVKYFLKIKFIEMRNKILLFVLMIIMGFAFNAKRIHKKQTNKGQKGLPTQVSEVAKRK